MGSDGVVFLMFHELELPGRRLCQGEPGYVRYIVNAVDFRSQMELLKREGWKGVSVGEAIDSFAEKTVTITFDDGCETDLISAAPILRDLNFGATFYITTGFLGHQGYLAPSQVRELSELGFEIGCHSMSHPYLTDLNKSDMHREIAGAKEQLEQILGRAVLHFSCPGGRYNGRVAELARRAGYQTVATSRIQVNSKSSDRFALGRVAVMRTTTPVDLLRICDGQSLWKMNLQVQLAAASKKLLGNSTYDRLRAALLR